MDDQKKQKVLLGALAVAALGAGSYFFLIRDSGEDARRSRKSGPTVLKERVVRDKTKAKAKKGRARVKSKDAKAVTAKKGRKKTERRTSERKGRGQRKKAKVKKKKLAPAA